MKTYEYKGILISKNEFKRYYVQGIPFKTLTAAKSYIDRCDARGEL